MGQPFSDDSTTSDKLLNVLIHFTLSIVILVAELELLLRSTRTCYMDPDRIEVAHSALDWYSLGIAVKIGQQQVERYRAFAQIIKDAILLSTMLVKPRE